MIQYNRCAITDAESALSEAAASNAPQFITKPTFAWFELIR
jgi:hypothetical protein